MKILITLIVFLISSCSLVAQQNSIKFMGSDSRTAFENYKSLGGAIGFDYKICEKLSAEITVGLLNASASFTNRFTNFNQQTIEIQYDNRELNFFTDFMGKFSVINIKDKHRFNLGIGPSLLYARSEFLIFNGRIEELAISKQVASAFIPMLGLMAEYEWKISKSFGLFTRYNYRTSFGETAIQNTSISRIGFSQETSGIRSLFNFSLGFNVYL